MKNIAILAILAAMVAVGVIVPACGGNDPPAASPSNTTSSAPADSSSAAPAASSSAPGK
ncbi:MAG: hypothetical protein M3O36_12270 [Myxococcota bacterium]|nr:hypothetical protein [Myxococcota bacterium]